MSSPEQPTNCTECRARIFFAHSHTTGEQIPLNVTPVDQTTPGALVLIGHTAFSKGDAIDHLVERGRVNEPVEDFPAYQSHRSTCKYAGDHRSDS